LLAAFAQSSVVGAPGRAGTDTGDSGSAGNGRERYSAVADATQGSGDVAAAATLGNMSGPTVVDSSSAAAPATPDAAPTSGNVADQVASQLARMVSNGTGEMVMKLHPPELGDLTVRVAVSGRDVTAWFGSAQPQVQNAISAAIGQLQTNLGDAGYNLSGAWVGADASGGQQNANSPTPLPSLAAGPAAPPLAMSSVAAARPATSGVNIYV
jgi:flagellar hook-length control protein FliK